LSTTGCAPTRRKSPQLSLGGTISSTATNLVAAHLDLASYFPPATGSTVAPVTAPALDNGAKPHDAQHYLTKKTTGRIITAAVPS
jgi:hypothetical protein